MRAVHLVNPMWDATGGSETRTLTLYRLLRQADGCLPTLWSTATPHAALLAEAPIQRVDAALGRLPKGGTLVFVGIYFPFGDWLAAAGAERVVVVVNTNNPAALAENLARLQAAGHDRIELVMTSVALWQAMGRRGQVLPSYIDVDAFPAVPQAPARPFTIGRLSRDEAFKHHPEDAIIYQDVLTREGCVRLMGATTLAPAPRPQPGLVRQAAGSQPAAEFLAHLDCFFYRTAPSWFETFGRVVHEAMCSGLPVLCHRSVGGGEQIEHGRNGLMFETTGEALDLIDRLRREPAWRHRLGQAARESMLEFHGVQLRRATLDFLLR